MVAGGVLLLTGVPGIGKTTVRYVEPRPVVRADGAQLLVAFGIRGLSAA